MTMSKHPDGPDSHRWGIPKSLRTCLLRLDGQVGAVVNVERHVVNPAVVSGEVAGQLGRLAQQMDLGAGDGTVEQPSSATRFGPIKPGFTREAGLIRRQVSDR
jgi:hypothetical protein